MNRPTSTTKQVLSLTSVKTVLTSIILWENLYTSTKIIPQIIITFNF